MNERSGAWKRFIDALREYKKSIFTTLGAAAIIWLGAELLDYFETKPITINLQSPRNEMSIASSFEHQIRPAFNRYCARPNWQKWLAQNILSQECVRISFEPHALASMRTRRLPYKETADPAELLRLFIYHHRGCLEATRKGDMIVISEPEDSDLLREGGTFICPRS